MAAMVFVVLLNLLVFDVDKPLGFWYMMRMLLLFFVGVNALPHFGWYGVVVVLRILLLKWETHDLLWAALLLACPDLVLTRLVFFNVTRVVMLLFVVGGDALCLL